MKCCGTLYRLNVNHILLLCWHYTAWNHAIAPIKSLHWPRSKAEGCHSLTPRERASWRTLSIHLMLGLPCGRWPAAWPFRDLWMPLSAHRSLLDLDVCMDCRKTHKPAARENGLCGPGQNGLKTVSWPRRCLATLTTHPALKAASLKGSEGVWLLIPEVKKKMIIMSKIKIE